MRIKTLATNIDLDLATMSVFWDKKSKKREASFSIEFSEDRILEVWHDGHYQLWVEGECLSEGSLWSEILTDNVTLSKKKSKTETVTNVTHSGPCDSECFPLTLQGNDGDLDQIQWERRGL